MNNAGIGTGTTATGTGTLFGFNQDTKISLFNNNDNKSNDNLFNIPNKNLENSSAPSIFGTNNAAKPSAQENKNESNNIFSNISNQNDHKDNKNNLGISTNADNNKPKGSFFSGINNNQTEKEKKEPGILFQFNNNKKDNNIQTEKKEEDKKQNENNQPFSLFSTDNNKKENNKSLLNALSQPNNATIEKIENKININQNDNSNINNNISNNIQNNDNNNNNRNNIINNNENEEYKIMNKVPEMPFQFSDCKELLDYERNELLNMTNNEIIESFKTMLDNQQKQFKKCVEKTRIIESKYIESINISNESNKFYEQNVKKGGNMLAKLNSMTERYKNMEKAIEFIDNKMTEVLKPYKENIMNSDSFLFSQNNLEKFKFYEDLMQVSKKCFTIENNLNEAENNLNKKEKEIADRSNEIENNDGNLGVWVERPNKKNYFINQNEMNSILAECYDGLSNLKSMQDNIDNKYELLKKTLLKGTGNNEMFY